MAKPPDLQWPCSTCNTWSEKEYTVHEVPGKMLWNGQIDIRACEFDPRFCAPDLGKRCPYHKYFGKAVPVVYINCDICDKEIYKFVMGEKPIPEADTDTGLYICNKCLERPEFLKIRAGVLSKRGHFK